MFRFSERNEIKGNEKGEKGMYIFQFIAVNALDLLTILPPNFVA